MKHWEVPQMWTGDCWIIGGGASMLKEFEVPTEVISKVESGEFPLSAYSEYLTPLHSKNVIGTNVAFMLGEWISVAYFCDAGFFAQYKEAYLSFRNLKVTCVNHIYREVMPLTLNIKRLKRDYKPGLSVSPDTICWNHNTGGAAINFAVLAGAKRILLLGFDMNPTAERTHWHNLYPGNTDKNTFDKFSKYFLAIAEDAKKVGVEILNVSSSSSLNVFPKVPLKEVI